MGFITKDKIKNSNRNTDGWGKCDLRETLNETIYNGLTEIKNYIKEVSKPYCASESGAVSYCDDKLWLLSYAEILKDNIYSPAREGNQYKYYKNINNNNDIKKHQMFVELLIKEHLGGFNQLIHLLTFGIVNGERKGLHCSTKSNLCSFPRIFNI